MQKLKFVFTLIFTGMILGHFALPVVAYGNQKIFLKKGCAYLIVFNEKVERFKVDNPEAVNVEVVTSIFTDKHEIIVKPLKAMDTNIFIWTKKGMYDFNIFINKKETAKNIQFDSDKNAFSKETTLQVEAVEIDAPPLISKDFHDKTNFVIDEPPKEVKK